jgi:nucleoside-diphosphate-sugar epimerase
MQGKKILVTGLTGQVAYPVACAYAKNNEVWGAARFSDPAKRADLESKGIRCVPIDLESGDFSALPTDFDYVFHFAVFRNADDDFDLDIRTNAESTGLLMSHCRKAKGFLHVSSTAVYQSVGHEPLLETSALGDNHRAMMTTYSITKIATEAVVRYAAREYQLPTVIARLCVPYGNNGGWPYYHLLMMKNGASIPVHENKPNIYSLIHEDDIIASIPALLESASVPANIVNWGGQERVSIEDWSAYIGQLTGSTPQFQYTTQCLESVIVDNAKLQKIAGPLQVHWKDGLRRMIEARNPEWLV